MNYKFHFLFLLLFVTIKSLGGDKPAFSLGLDYHHGFLLNHSPKSGNESLSLTTVRGLEASIQWQTFGKKEWQRYYGFPRWGVSFIYYDIGVKKYGGNGFALLIYEIFKIVNTSFFELNFRAGTGIGTFSDPYNKEKNPGNLWISAPVNTSLHFSLETRYTLSSQWQAVIGGTFTHFSNGAITMPNLGVNFPSVNFSLRYTPFPKKLIYRDDSIAGGYKKNYLHLSLAGAVKVLADYGTTYYPTYMISAHYGRRISRISKVIIGLDGFRDESILDDSIVKSRNPDINRLGVFGGHELMQGKLGFVVGAGYYIYKKTTRDPNIYLRVGLRYHILKNIFVAAILKTHYGQADSFEWTGGYTF